jgi:hypothetical protein
MIDIQSLKMDIAKLISFSKKCYKITIKYPKYLHPKLRYSFFGWKRKIDCMLPDRYITFQTNRSVSVFFDRYMDLINFIKRYNESFCLSDFSESSHIDIMNKTWY